MVAACLLLPLGEFSEASAQSGDGEVSKPDQKRAETLFKQGAELFYVGKFAKALVKFKAADAIAPNAMITYNISLVHVRLGNLDDALAAAQRANQGKLPRKARTQNDARIVALRRVLTSQQMTGSIAKRTKRSDSARPVQPIAPVAKSSFGAVGWTGVSVAIIGAGSLVASGVIESSLGGDIDAYRQAAGDRDAARHEDLEASINSKQTYGQALLFGGAGLLAVGGGMVIYELLEAPDSGRSAVTLDASVGADSAAVGIGISF
jgi:tetratricopeptide (TPR) repeat protein